MNQQGPARRRLPWYRRPLWIVPIAMLVVMMIAGGVIGYRTLAAFETVQSLSTPPPELSGAALGGDEDIVIDTGPAQEAVRQQQEREQARNDPGNGNARGNQHAVASEPGRGNDVAQASTGTVSTEATSATEPAAAPDAVQTTRTDSGLVVAVTPSTGSAVAPVPLEPVDTGGTNFLLMGVDAGDGESIDAGVRPDALAVLHLDDVSGSCRILSIPRDSRATLPGYGFSKINHALAIGGIPYEMQVVEGYLGIELDHYALVDFAGVTRIVDSVGGIVVENPEAFRIGGIPFAAGPIQLDGEAALLYARYRGGADGDFGRISRQQQVLRAVLDRARDVNLVTLVPSSFSLLADHFRTDLGPTEMAELATRHLDTCTSESLETSTISGDAATLYDDLMRMDLSFVVSDPAAIAERVDWLLGVD